MTYLNGELSYNTNKRGQRRITSLKRTEPLGRYLHIWSSGLNYGTEFKGPLDSTSSMNRRDFLSSRAHHDHHNLTPGLLRALILLFSIQSFVSPVECSFSGSELLTSGNRDGEKTRKLRKALTNRLCLPTEPLNTESYTIEMAFDPLPSACLNRR